MTEVSEADKRISEELQKLAKKMEEALELIAGQRVGFCFVVFQSENDSATSYVSNCHRDEVADSLRKLLDGWEAGIPEIPAHELNRKLN